MKSHKTPEQIKSEIEALRAIKPKVRRLSFFGDNNHAAIDAQIDVLEKGLSEDKASRIYSSPDYIYSEAMNAVYWRSGEADDFDRLVDGWKELAK